MPSFDKVSINEHLKLLNKKLPIFIFLVTIIPIVITDDDDLRMGLIGLLLFLSLISFVIRLRDWSPVKKIGKLFKRLMIVMTSLTALITLIPFLGGIYPYLYPSPEKIAIMQEAKEIKELERAEAIEIKKKKEKEEEEQKKVELEAEQERERAEGKEEKRKGFHCLSGWDGSHRALKNYVTDNMNDPDSFEHVSTKIGPVNQSGEHYLVMTYRGSNAFGGLVLNSISATVKNNDCSATIN